MKVYKYGDITFSFDIDIPFLPLCTPSNDDIYKIELKYEKVDNSGISISTEEEYIQVNLATFAEYLIYPQEKRIIAYVRNENYFLSTFFNIPCSVLALINDRLLLHSSGVVYNGELFNFTANKGVGKTTLMSILLLKECDFFSDDTIILNINPNQILANTTVDLIKLCEDTYSSLVDDNFEIKNKNVAGKACIMSSELCAKGAYLGTLPVKKIIKINRHSYKSPVIKQMISRTAKMSLFISNIVGITHFNIELYSKVLEITNNINFDLIKFYNLFLPDDLKTVMSLRAEDLLPLELV